MRAIKGKQPPGLRENQRILTIFRLVSKRKPVSQAAVTTSPSLRKEGDIPQGSPF